jgi:hypothetical protein
VSDREIVVAMLRWDAGVLVGVVIDLKGHSV